MTRRGKQEALPLDAVPLSLHGDPLGEAFIAARSPKMRRETGTVYTPPEIVRAMMGWAESRGPFHRVVDPGAGSGRFLLAAGRAFPDATLVGIENDPEAADVLRRNVEAAGLARRTRTVVDDYLQTPLEPVEGRTLFIGNPPYVRHHGIGPDAKRWYAETAARYGIRASKLAGLHLHFFVRTLELAAPGDEGAFVTASEWLDVNYGETLRRLLGGPLGGTGLHLIDPAAIPFAGTQTTGVVTAFHVGRRPDSLRVGRVERAEDLGTLDEGEDVPWERAIREKRWTHLLAPPKSASAGLVELGELCRVHRGTVTGNNRVWIEGAGPVLPDRFLVPAITRAQEIIRAGARLTGLDHLKRVIDLPVDLDGLGDDDRTRVERFLAWAKELGADLSYTARHRRRWWEVRLQAPAPIVSTYMARRAPAFVRNPLGARHINIAHGLYPRDPLSEAQLDALAEFLRGNVETTSGRTYAGGLTKFEPKELERVLVPRPERLLT